MASASPLSAEQLPPQRVEESEAAIEISRSDSKRPTVAKDERWRCRRHCCWGGMNGLLAVCGFARLLLLLLLGWRCCRGGRSTGHTLRWPSVKKTIERSRSRSAAAAVAINNAARHHKRVQFGVRGLRKGNVGRAENIR